MYYAKVYKIMFGSPSDIKEELNIFFDIIAKWNTSNSEKYGIILQPLHWSTNSYPLTGKPGQKIINDELVAKSDLLICVFGGQLGTNTDTHDSGTVEEIDEHIKAGKDVMIYFKKMINIDPDNFDQVQFNKLRSFKENIKDKCLYIEFEDSKNFKELFFRNIQQYINTKWLNNPIKIKDNKNINSDCNLSDFDIKRMKAWTSTNNPQFFSMYFEGGSSFIKLGANNKYEIKNGREQIEWNDFFDRMQNNGFIEIEKYDKFGHPIYRLKKAAYVYFNSIKE